MLYKVLVTFWDDGKQYEAGAIIDRDPGSFTRINCAKCWLEPFAEPAAKVVEAKPTTKKKRTTRGRTKDA